MEKILKQYNYKTKGTCAREIVFSLDDDNIIRELDFINGCDGNLKGIAALCIGKKANEVATLLQGITCGRKDTSCPDQLSMALKEI